MNAKKTLSLSLASAMGGLCAGAGIGLAVMNRMGRAAAFDIEQV